MNNFDRTKEQMLQIQQDICAMLERADGQQTFELDQWEREAGGGGRTMVLSNGKTFEQAGVNFSHVFGEGLPPSATQGRPELAGASFQATGVSIVIHPHNPYVPTSHFNVRLFMAQKEGMEPIWWFGGGFDLTPYYGFDEDCVTWHEHSQKAVGDVLYPKFKKWCDDYFYLKHRQEPRGIGGLFFDDFNEKPFDECLAMISNVAKHFSEAYETIVNRRKDHEYGERERSFQLYRRGRYVEFNLVYDRGTLFGLQSGGRTESILMSLPPIVNWAYNWQPEAGSAEAELYERYLKPREWLHI